MWVGCLSMMGFQGIYTSNNLYKSLFRFFHCSKQGILKNDFKNALPPNALPPGPLLGLLRYFPHSLFHKKSTAPVPLFCTLTLIPSLAPAVVPPPLVCPISIFSAQAQTNSAAVVLSANHELSTVTPPLTSSTSWKRTLQSP